MLKKAQGRGAEARAVSSKNAVDNEIKSDVGSSSFCDFIFSMLINDAYCKQVSDVLYSFAISCFQYPAGGLRVFHFGLPKFRPVATGICG